MMTPSSIAHPSGQQGAAQPIVLLTPPTAPGLPESKRAETKNREPSPQWLSRLLLGFLLAAAARATVETISILAR
jgi:hypothetical protein